MYDDDDDDVIDTPIYMTTLRPYENENAFLFYLHLVIKCI